MSVKVDTYQQLDLEDKGRGVNTRWEDNFADESVEVVWEEGEGRGRGR
jgi:hypothetical protein